MFFYVKFPEKCTSNNFEFEKQFFKRKNRKINFLKFLKEILGGVNSLNCYS